MPVYALLRGVAYPCRSSSRCARDKPTEMDASLDLQVVVRWLTFLPIVVCSIFGLAITLAKWRQLRRPVLPDDSTLATLRRYVEVEDFDADAEHGINDTRPPLLGLLGTVGIVVVFNRLPCPLAWPRLSIETTRTDRR